MSVVFGGLSFEHEISIVSAISLKKIIGQKITNYIFLDSTHRFYLIPSEQMKAKFFASGEYKRCKELFLQLGGFASKGFLGSRNNLGQLGVVLNLIHGADGEDGKICALLDFYKIPFIGPRLEACVLSFNKHLTKSYATLVGVKTLDYEFFYKNQEIKPTLPYPFIIKPTRLGSSIGVYVVENQDALEYALDSAFSFDNEIIIEPFYKGVREYNLAGFKCQNGDFVFSFVEEPKKNDLLGFDEKYLDFSRTTKPKKAEITEELESQLQTAFKKLYNTTFEGALIRCDFFVIDDEVFLNEINPIPGSMANYLFEDFNSIVDSLSQNLPRTHSIKVTYNYIEQIQRAKGK